MRRRVVITGVGWVTPMGSRRREVWQGLKQGDSGVGYTSIFDASHFPTKISAEVRDWDISEVGEDPEAWKLRGRHTRFAVGAAKKAIRDSGLLERRSIPTRLGVYLGSGEGQQDFDCFARMMTARAARRRVRPGAVHQGRPGVAAPDVELEQEPNMPAGHLAIMFNAQGPNANCLTACAASSQAIGEAAEIIRRGDADVMLSGGTHSMIHPFGVTGFNLLTALCTNNEQPARRPRGRSIATATDSCWAKERPWWSSKNCEHAKRRGANIYGELTGYGSTADAFRITDTHPEGRGATRCIKLALDDAGLNPDDIHYINAHGTSTNVNDEVETLAIKQVFGEHAYKVPVSSTKSMMGHLIAAAGAIELIICLLAIRDGVLPPTINYHTPDPECDLDYVPNEARQAKCDVALSNSFGFGGQNISLIVSRHK